MFYTTNTNDHGLPHDPFKAIVAPRPIGWISSISAKGEVNLAPYSYFNGVSSRPPVVCFSSEGRKDSLTFIEETGEFVCNLATWELREAMNVTSAPFPRGVDELGAATARRRDSLRDGMPCTADGLAQGHCRQAARPSRRVRPGARRPHR